MRVRLEQMIFPRLVTRFSVTRRKKGAWRTKKKKKKENALLFISESTERAAYIGIYNGDPEIHRIIRRTRIVTNLPCYLFICLL